MSQDLGDKKSNYISRLAASMNKAIDARQELLGLLAEYNSLGYADALKQEDFTLPNDKGQATSANRHLTPAILAAGFKTLAAVEAVLAQPEQLANLLAFRP